MKTICNRSGALRQTVWTGRKGPDKPAMDKPAMDMVAHAAMTTYHVTRKRRAMQSEKVSAHANSQGSGLDDDTDI